MDAFPLLALIAESLERHRLEAVLIGNSAAALQGAPVTTVDFDFLFRKTRQTSRSSGLSLLISEQWYCGLITRSAAFTGSFGTTTVYNSTLCR